MMKAPKSPEEWKEMDKYFCHHSYADGFKLTDKDANLLKQFSSAISSEYVHIVRWYNHMKAVCPAAAATVTCVSAPKQAAKPAAAPVAPKPAAAPVASAADDDDDDDIDLFGSDDDDAAAAEAERIKQERLKAYHEKKSKKPAVIAKSSIILDVKPWDDETDMAEMEKQVRSIQMDGLLWGVSKLVPVGYGIKKLQIGLVIEDDKVSVDLLTEEIEKFEDFVQSVDVAAFNKI